MDRTQSESGGDKGDSGGLIYQQMRKFINVIDELRDVGL